jgi:hypothetical protein
MKKQKQINTTQTNNNIKKIQNWSQYNKSLENRGDFTVLLNTAYLNNMPIQTGKAGHPTEYTDAVILFLAQLREFMRLPIRQTIGMAKFILNLAGLELKLPSRSTISRRLGSLKVPTGLNSNQFTSPIIFLPDSTGLKISGEGEWKVKKHGVEKRREWLKLHIGVDYTSRMIVSSNISSSNASDGKYLKGLLRKAKQNCGHGKGRKIIEQVVGDGAYGGNDLYRYVEKSGSKLLVPPQINAVVHYDIEGDVRNGKIIDSPGWETRNNYIRDIKRLGRDEWKKQSGYHKRSLAETAMSRLMRIFGGRLKSKTRRNQVAEANIRILLLNTFTSCGLPRYAM